MEMPGELVGRAQFSNAITARQSLGLGDMSHMTCPQKPPEQVYSLAAQQKSRIYPCPKFFAHF